MSVVDFDVTDLGPTDHVAEGERAPAFTRPLVTAEFWEDVPLSTLCEDAPVVLLFHPMDGDFPATYLWNEVRDRGWADRATVVGLSISTPYEHRGFILDRGIEDYALYADPSNGVAEAFGIVHDLDGMTGISEPRPAAYVLEADRTVRYAWVATEWPSFPDYDDIEAVIG